MAAGDSLSQLELLPGERGEWSDNIIDRAVRFKLVVLAATPGPGGSGDLRDYFAPADRRLVWLDMLKTNNRDRFWELFGEAVSGWSARLSAQLRGMPFPVSLPERNQLFEALRNACGGCGEPVILLCGYLNLVPGPIRELMDAVIAATSQSVSYILSGDGGRGQQLPQLFAPVTLECRDLVFDRQSIFFYLKMNMDVELCEAELDRAEELTGGWAAAVHMLGLVLGAGRPPAARRIEVAEERIFDEIEHKYFRHLQPSVREGLVLFSLTEEMVPELADRLAGIGWDNLMAIAQRVPLFQYRPLPPGYTLRTVFRRFLTARQPDLPAARRATFLRGVGEWCQSRGSFLEAVTYYTRAGAWDTLRLYLERVNALSLEADVCARCERLLEEVPAAYLDAHPMLCIYRILIRLRNGNSLMALDELQRLERRLRTDSALDTQQRLAALGELHLLNALLNLSHGREYLYELELAARLLPKGTRFWRRRAESYVNGESCLHLGGPLSMDESVEHYRRAAPLLRVTLRDHGQGVEHLAACEAHFCRGEFDEALRSADEAILVATAHRQWDIAANACYLCMRVALGRGNWEQAVLYRDACRGYCDRDGHPHPLRVADMAEATLYYCMGQKHRVARWIRRPDRTLMERRPPAARELLCIVHHMAACEQNHEALALAETALAACGERWKWHTRLCLQIIRAVMLQKLDKPDRAAEQLAACYLETCGDGIIIPFAEHRQAMRSLVRAARGRHAARDIPAAWLDRVEREAAVFEHGVKQIRKNYFRTAAATDFLQLLSRREQQAVNLLCEDKSMAEIAAAMGVSVNTVKSTLSHSYKKLGVRNRMEAVHLLRDDN